MLLITSIFVSISLSMDAFSLAIIYGMFNYSLKKMVVISAVVGIFHFLMPLIGFSLGSIFLNLAKTKIDIVAGVIFLWLSLEMFLSIKRKDEIMDIGNLFSILIFAFSVSVDSFGAGLAISSLDSKIVFSCLMFSFFSFLFTFTGLFLGKYLSTRFGVLSKALGSILLLLISVYYLTK